MASGVAQTSTDQPFGYGSARRRRRGRNSTNPRRERAREGETCAGIQKRTPGAALTIVSLNRSKRRVLAGGKPTRQAGVGPESQFRR